MTYFNIRFYSVIEKYYDRGGNLPVLSQKESLLEASSGNSVATSIGHLCRILGAISLNLFVI